MDFKKSQIYDLTNRYLKIVAEYEEYLNRFH